MLPQKRGKRFTIAHGDEFGYSCLGAHAFGRNQCDNVGTRALSLGVVRGRTWPAMPSTHKKVIVRKMDRESVAGYVAPTAFVTEGRVEVLNTAGKVVAIELRDIKGVYFVREFTDSEALSRKTFTTRPRTEGLWVRVQFKDNEVLEGMMPNDLAQIPAEGIMINPPDTRANTQRVFIPRTAVGAVTVLGVIGGHARRRRAAAAAEEQQPLFEAPSS